ncbi:hypothetical protein [Clostridium sp.]|uniref:hypothetical protein n=1 Tax=Clostridium sp. TaxID=1506 RepID=UPI003F394D66
MNIVQTYSEYIRGSIVNIGSKSKLSLCNGVKRKAVTNAIFNIPKKSEVKYSQLAFSINILNDHIPNAELECELRLTIEGIKSDTDIFKININPSRDIYTQVIDISDMLLSVIKSNINMDISICSNNINENIEISCGWSIITVYENESQSFKKINVYYIYDDDCPISKVKIEDISIPSYKETCGKLHLGLWKGKSDNLVWNIENENTQYKLTSRLMNHKECIGNVKVWGLLNTDISKVLGVNQKLLEIIFLGYGVYYNVTNLAVEVETNDDINDDELLRENNYESKSICNESEVYENIDEVIESSWCAVEEQAKVISTLGVTRNINTKSIVIMLKNNKSSIAEVEIIIKDLESTPYEAIKSKKVMLPNDEARFIIDSPPKRYEIIFAGIYDEVLVWCAERVNNANQPISKSLFIKNRRFNRKNLVPISD